MIISLRVVDESSAGSVDDLLWCFDVGFCGPEVLVTSSWCSVWEGVQEADNGLKESESEVRDGCLEQVSLCRIGCVGGTGVDVRMMSRWTCFTVHVGELEDEEEGC